MSRGSLFAFWRQKVFRSAAA
uniref:Uncharacterized protein n=1 Tax=Anguilla anguilla TaxID=7936 RepID=A0A0E9QYB3_ANGAN